MSKSKGNVIDPWMMCDTHGADALRWNFLSAGQPWTTRRVSDDGIRETTRKTLLTLWNVFSFFATYADLDGWTPDASRGRRARRTCSTAGSSASSPTRCRWSPTRSTASTRSPRRHASRTFVDDLSNWYVRRSRPRFWKSSDPRAHATLHRCLVTTTQLLAPLCPFLVRRDLHRAHRRALGAHRPTGRAAAPSDPSLATEMQAVRRLVTVGRAAAQPRQRRRCASRCVERCCCTRAPSCPTTARAEIADELNVKALDDIDSLSGLVSWTVVPNFRALGPRLGAKVNDVKAALAVGRRRRRCSAARSATASSRSPASGSPPTRSRCAPTGTRSSRSPQDGSWAVALDLELDDELRSEGTARELVRAVNDLRKAVGPRAVRPQSPSWSRRPDAMTRRGGAASSLDRGRGAGVGVHGRRRRDRRRGIG